MFPELTDTALVFGDEVTTFADLLLLGIATGLAEEAMGSTRRGLWALEQAGFNLPRESLLEEAVAFRRARRLESGQDLRAWLAVRQLTIEDWEAHLCRSLADKQVLTTDSPAGTVEIDFSCQAFMVDLTCGGWWQRLADLAARLWAATKLAGNNLAGADIDLSGEKSRIAGLIEPLTAVDELWCAEGLRRVRAGERALEEAARRCAPPDAVAGRILEHANEWTEVRFDELLLPTREAANEAALCALEDGLEAKDLAARAAMPLLEHRTRHDLLPVEMASLLDSALTDTPFGPVSHDEQWAVLWLRERRRPSLEDEAVRRAASAELLEEALDRVSQGLVRRLSTL